MLERVLFSHFYKLKFLSVMLLGGEVKLSNGLYFIINVSILIVFDKSDSGN